jgi:hypothetical protein
MDYLDISSSTDGARRDKYPNDLAVAFLINAWKLFARTRYVIL